MIALKTLKAKMNKFENWKDHKVFKEVEKWREKSYITKKNKNRKLTAQAVLCCQDDDFVWGDSINFE